MINSEITGIMRFWEHYGILIVILLILASFGITYISVKIYGLITKFNDSIDMMEALHAAHKDSEGKIIVLHGHHERSKARILDIRDMLLAHVKATTEHFASAQRHYDDVERLSNDEHWKNCPVDKCPNFTNLLLTYQKSVSAQDRLVDDVEKISGELSAWTIEILAILRASKEAKSNGK